MTFFLYLIIFFKKMGQPRPLFVYFQSFLKQTIQISQQINLKKCPSSIRHWDSNTWPFKHDSSPITTRPGLPPIMSIHILTLHSHPSVCHQSSWIVILSNSMEISKYKYTVFWPLQDKTWPKPSLNLGTYSKKSSGVKSICSVKCSITTTQSFDNIILSWVSLEMY